MTRRRRLPGWLVLPALVCGACGVTDDAAHDGGDSGAAGDSGVDASAFDAAGVDGGTPDSGAPPASPKLILHSLLGGVTATPSYIVANLAYLETLPFDGLVVYGRTADLSVNASAAVISPNALSYDDAASVFSPMAGLSSETLTDNFAIVFTFGYFADFFDDVAWGRVADNFASFARAAREAGLRGIFLDNEEYADQASWSTGVLWSCWGDGNAFCACGSSAMTLEGYETEARLRGRQMMEAITGEWPNAAVIVPHGPYESVLDKPAELFRTGVVRWQCNNLKGPFFAGLLEGAGPETVVYDGGELYFYRTAAEFDGSYDWRKHTIALPATGVTWIPDALRADWPERTSISFGLYLDFSPPDDNPTPDELRDEILPAALGTSDGLVWMYTEGPSFLEPTSALDEWLAAIREGRSRARR